MLEAARRLERLRASPMRRSSSVYGANKKQPFSVDDRVEQPVSLYAATKRGCELIARSYSHLYRLPATGLRFFTVYGPWGRPDMAAYLFTEAILAGEPIKVFNQGRMARDFTYIDDIVAGTIAALDHPPPEPAATGSAPDLQSRQSPAGTAARFHRGARAGARAAPRTSNCCRCSRATCPKALPTSRPRGAIWASSRRFRSRKAWRALSRWYKRYHRIN